MKVTDIRRKLLATLAASGMLAPVAAQAADLNVNLIANEGGGGSHRVATSGLVLNLSLIPYGFPVPNNGHNITDQQVNIGASVNVQAGINNKTLMYIKPLTLNGVVQPAELNGFTGASVPARFGTVTLRQNSRQRCAPFESRLAAPSQASSAEQASAGLIGPASPRISGSWQIVSSRSWRASSAE